MLLIGNEYGGKRVALGQPVLIAETNFFGSGALLYRGVIAAILDDGSPITAIIGAPDPCSSTSRSFVYTSDESQVLAMLPGQWTWPLTSKTVLGAKTTALSGDASATFGEGWKTIHSGMF